MPKRKRDDLDSYIKKKIKKLERKLLKRRHRHSSSSDSVHSSEEFQDDAIIESENANYLTETVNELDPTPSTSCLDSQQGLDLIESIQEAPMQSEIEQVPASENEDKQSQDLDDMTLEILGTDPAASPIFGKAIQKDLATRFEFLATSGLTKDARKDILQLHLPPANCKLIDAPSLNPEIKVAITEVIAKRDKALQVKQRQISSAIACVGEAISLLLSKDTKDPAVLKLLMDAGRILCDSQHNDSVTRRNFILAVLKKDLKDQIQLTKIDNLLFGQELAETLKTAKAINKSAVELKSNPPQKSSANKSRPPPSSRNLNWKAPVPSRRPTGPLRAKEPATSMRHQQVPSSRASRPSQQAHRGRR